MDWRTPVHSLRALVSLIASITLLCVLVWPPLSGRPYDSGQAYAQTKKKSPKAGPKVLPKQVPNEPPARAPFSPEDQAAAAIADIADARAWGDSAHDFERVLPSVRGPWLALSGGGADGAFGAGLLVGW